MDFVLDTRSAKKVVSSIFDTAPPVTSLSCKPGVRITADSDGTVEFYFGDSGLFISSKVSGEVKEPGSIRVELIPLFKAVSAFSPVKDRVGTENIGFSSDDQVLFVKAVSIYKDKKVRQRRQFPSYDAIMPEADKKDIGLIEVSLNKFSEALKKILVSAPSSSDVGAASGIYLNVSGNEFKLVSMDGPTLTEFIGETRSKDTEEVFCVLPTYFVSKFSKLLSKYVDEEEDLDSVNISISSNVFVIKFRDITISSSIINEAFPDYLSIFAEPKKQITVKSSIFLDNVRNILHGSDAKDNFRILVKSLGDELSLSTNSCMNDGIPIIEGSAFSVEFNATILDKCVRNLFCDEFSMLYTGKTGLVTIFPVGGPLKIRTAIAPLR